MPTGRVWHVNLIRENGKTFLQNGWSKFAKFYSLSQGHFLKFDFIGNSSFKVIIFGINACEILYPSLHSTPCNRPHESLSPPNKRQSTGFVNTPCSVSKEGTIRSPYYLYFGGILLLYKKKMKNILFIL